MYSMSHIICSSCGRSIIKKLNFFGNIECRCGYTCTPKNKKNLERRGRLHYILNGSWYCSGNIMTSSELFSCIAFMQQSPYYIEWLNTAELKHTNYTKDFM